MSDQNEFDTVKHWEDSDKFASNAAEKPPSPPVEVPVDALSAQALGALIESFILREGTDYGSVEISHETKVNQVQKQINKGEVRIIFDPDSESVTLLTAKEWAKLARSK